jgi:hypothetical protein
MRIDRRVPNRLSSVPETVAYRTRPGDTLRRIAERLGLRLSDLLAENSHIESADALLPPGQTIRLPTEQGPTVTPRRSLSTSFQVEYEKSRSDVFQRFAGRPPNPEMSGSGGGPQGPSDVTPLWEAIEKTLGQEAAAWKLVRAIKDFYQALAEERPASRPSDVEVRVGRLIYEMGRRAQAQSPKDLPGAIDAVTRWVQALDGNYRRFRKQVPPDLAMGLAVGVTLFQLQTNRLLTEILKDAYPEYFSKVGPKPLDWIEAAVTFTERVSGGALPQTFQDLFKVLKYLPATAVASLTGDAVRLAGDLVVALWRSSLGDFGMWDEVVSAMLNQAYGPVFQGWAFLADLFLTGGRNIQKVPMDKILFADLFDTGPVFRATPQLDRFLRTLRDPVFLSGLYRTGQLDPVAVAGQLFTDVEQNGTRLNFVGRLASALEAIASEVRTGRRSYAEWVMFREVVGAVVVEVLRRVDMLGPAWTARFRREVDTDALRRFYQELTSPVTDRDLRMWAELHGAALSQSDEVTKGRSDEVTG